MARAPRLHRGGREFDPLTAHQLQLFEFVTSPSVPLDPMKEALGPALPAGGSGLGLPGPLSRKGPSPKTIRDNSGKGGPLSRFSVASFVGICQLVAALASDGGRTRHRYQGPGAAAASAGPRCPEPRGDPGFEDVATTERDKLIIRLLADTGIR